MESKFVDNYLFLHGTSQNAKRIRRKFTKQKMRKMCHTKVYETFETDAIKYLYDYIVLIKQNKLKGTLFGVITDKNVLLNNITVIPPTPRQLQWDILCLDSYVSQYQLKDENNNLYWCKMNVQDTHNFVINDSEATLQKLLTILKQCKTWSDFIVGINNELRIFGITQHNLSENSDVYIDKLTVFSYNSYSKAYGKLLSKLKTPCIDANFFADKFDKIYNSFTSEEQYVVYPSVTCICILNDAKHFFHLLHSFLKIDYPTDKLQLVIVDDLNLESQIKSFLPNDSRIKIINVSQSKTQNQNLRLPVGYKLNLGVKYSEPKHELIFHMTDENSYFIDNFKTLVKVFLLSEKEILASYDCASSLSNAVNDIPNIFNLMYRKDVWQILPFIENESDSNVLLANFIKNRVPTVGFLPFLYFSFNYTVQDDSYTKPLTFKLDDMILHSVKESFDVSNK